MVYPKEIFDDPEQHWAHITIDSDDKLEGQFFDRKEAGRPGQNGRVDKKDVDGLRKHIKQTISAFANVSIVQSEPKPLKREKIERPPRAVKAVEGGQPPNEASDQHTSSAP